ncbi:hypothetical protein BG011_002387, partial [Mortierella polycephala]
ANHAGVTVQEVGVTQAKVEFDQFASGSHGYIFGDSLDDRRSEGEDDVNDEDIANAMQLCFENRAIKDDEEVDDIDMERVEEESEAAQVKAEYNEAWRWFRDPSEDLMNRCKEDAPWIKSPMVTHPRLVMRSHDNKLDY